MKRRCSLSVFLVLVLCSTAAWADQIILKSGQRYSGRFVRGDSSVVEFQILGRIESFKTAEVSQILFQEPEITVPAPARTSGTAPAKTQQAVEQPAVQPAARVAPTATASAVTFPTGTTIAIRTTSAIDTDTNKVGDAFSAVLDEPLMSGDRVVVPRGADVKGTIAYARQSGKLTGQSELILELTELKANGKSYVIRTSDYNEVGASRTRQTATAAGGVAAVGAIIGAIAGGGKGAAVGAATGAAVGTGAVVLTKGQTLKVPVETLLEFKLEHELVIDQQ
ncbi:MAG: hypothetical protein LAP85_07305 [Acidobacteriia bacterium]|nr:hypothetical protein [Terriglobia bacterium]